MHTYTAPNGQTYSGTNPVTLAAQGRMKEAINWLRQEPDVDASMLASVLAALPRHRMRRLAKLIRREFLNGQPRQKWIISIGGRDLPKAGEARTEEVYTSAPVGCGYQTAGRKTFRVRAVRLQQPMPGISSRFAEIIGEEVAE